MMYTFYYASKCLLKTYVMLADMSGGRYSWALADVILSDFFKFFFAIQDYAHPLVLTPTWFSV